jgi:cathepsin F
MINWNLAQEFKSKYLGLNTNLHKKSKMVMKQAAIPDIKVADEFDWRDHNAVTPVKNQVK